jgi:hypothetical protein
MTNKTALIEMKAPDTVFNKYSIEEVAQALISAGFENAEHYSGKGLYINARK